MAPIVRGILVAVTSISTTRSHDIFNFSSSTASTFGSWNGDVQEGSLAWPNCNHTAQLASLSSVLSASEARQIMDELRLVGFDRDADSVDHIASEEFYLEKHGSIDETLASNPRKPDSDPTTLAERVVLRKRIAQITTPVIEGVIQPFVNSHYQTSCGGKCRVCHSLIRRYREGERRAHKIHFDVHALVTAVVSLNAFGSDFEGGIYVSTGKSRSFLKLGTGDAVVHQSDLLHGVDVSKGNRWSWILWFQDAANCDADNTNWQLSAAKSGNPVAQYIQSRRLLNGGKSKDQAAKWLYRAAKQGFSRAQNALGDAYEHGMGVKPNRTKAKNWYKKAAVAGEIDAMHNYAMIHIMASDFDIGLPWLRKAAEAGSPSGAEDMGYANWKGMAGLKVDLQEAAKWLEVAGTPSALYKRGKVAQEQGHTETSDEVMTWMLRSAWAGFSDACHHLLRDPSRYQQQLLGCLAKESDPQSQYELARIHLSRNDESKAEKQTSTMLKSCFV
eukprot:TRINITY_DN12216_c1_g1_i2.p1 TRINITY_DN12216_c1_g1~~TRINITY_DN12216_c1_g1_i2.p1  ORF type:complete len:510 (+),score=41.77 TRINITY_DN12216_c1_g1_i2:29-1531(+)